jgi:hypothetical protein
MHKFLAPFTAAAVLLAAMPAAAHDEMSVVGQVTAVTAKTVQLRTKSGQTVTLEVDGNTRVLLAGKRLGLKDVKVGQAVKALGMGDSMTSLVAIDVEITPAAKAK